MKIKDTSAPEMVKIIAKAIKAKNYEYVSKNSIRIWLLNTNNEAGEIISSIEVEWKIRK